MSSVSRGIDRIEVTFDDPNLVANAGLLLVATLGVRLGLEALINEVVDLSGRVGGALPGRKVLTLVHAMAAGGSHIDHADVLRSGATQSVLPHRVKVGGTIDGHPFMAALMPSGKGPHWLPLRAAICKAISKNQEGEQVAISLERRFS